MEWVKFEEQLPENYQEILAMDSIGRMESGTFYDGVDKFQPDLRTGYRDIFCYVYWIPKPELPKQ